MLMIAIYFEIQADNVNRAADFYRRCSAGSFPRSKSLPIPYWHIETGSGSGGGLLKRPAERPPAQMRDERLCLLVRGRAISIELRQKY